MSRSAFGAFDKTGHQTVGTKQSAGCAALSLCADVCHCVVVGMARRIINNSDWLRDLDLQSGICNLGSAMRDRYKRQRRGQIQKGDVVIFRPDSRYVVGLLLGKFTAKENVLLSAFAQHLYKTLGKYVRTLVVWEKAHSGGVGNTKADHLVGLAKSDGNLNGCWQRPPLIEWDGDEFAKTAGAAYDTMEYGVKISEGIVKIEERLKAASFGTQKKRKKPCDAILIDDPPARTREDGADLLSISQVTTVISCAVAKCGAAICQRKVKVPATDPDMISLNEAMLADETHPNSKHPL